MIQESELEKKSQVAVKEEDFEVEGMQAGIKEVARNVTLITKDNKRIVNQSDKASSKSKYRVSEQQASI